MNLFGLRDFATRDEIRRFIVNSKNFRKQVEAPGASKDLLFFETKKQRTWLLATPHRVYCILDDRRKPSPHINWSMSRDRVFAADGRQILPVEVSERDRPSDRSGLLHFGPKHRRWLYTKALFASQSPVDEVSDFLSEAMS